MVNRRRSWRTAGVLDYAAPRNALESLSASRLAAGAPPPAPQEAARLDDLCAVLLLLLPHLTLAERARLACVCRAWRALLSHRELWSRLDGDFEASGAGLAALLARAGPELCVVSLRLGGAALEDGAAAAALVGAACAAPGLRVLSAVAPSGTAALWSAAQAATVLAACPALRELEVGVAATVLDEPLLALLRAPRLAARVLDLRRALLNPRDGARLVPALAPRGHLRCLDLTFNSLGDGGAAALAAALAAGAPLQHLLLGYNDIGDAGAAAIAAALPASALVQLDLRHNRVGAPGARALADALRPAGGGGVTLRDLCLQHNPLGPDGASALARALRRPGCRLAALDVGYCELLGAGARALFGALRVNGSLRSLSLAFNGLVADEARDLARVLGAQRGAPHLARLDLSRNALGPDGVGELCAALKEHRALEELLLQVVACGPDGARRLGGLLRQSVSLRLLDASGACNALGDRGAREVAAGAAENAGGPLRALVLESNAIADGGAHELAAALRWHGRLECLGLRGNRIGCDGARGLAAAVGRAAALRVLDMRENLLLPSERGALALVAAAAAPPRVRALRLLGVPRAAA